MEKTFYNEDRPIKIKVNSVGNYITFHFPHERDREFYWIEVDDWKNSDRHWEEHMERKRWFTKDMTVFINSQI